MNSQTDPGTPAIGRFAVITEFLDGVGIGYDLVEHPSVMTAAAEARVAGTAPDAVAKTIVLHDGDRYVIAVVAASERLDVHKLRNVLGATKHLRLATEEEISADFPDLDVGAVPPFGPRMAAVAEVLDRGLMDQPFVLCPAGDHEHSVRLDPRDIRRITRARVADIRQD